MDEYDHFTYELLKNKLPSLKIVTHGGNFTAICSRKEQITDASDFFVTLPCHNDLANQINEKMEKNYGHLDADMLQLSEANPEDLCAVLYNISKDLRKRWHRGLIQEKIGDKFLVFFVDLGFTDVVEYSHLKILDKSVTKFPALSVRCSYIWANNRGVKYADDTEIQSEFFIKGVSRASNLILKKMVLINHLVRVNLFVDGRSLETVLKELLHLTRSCVPGIKAKSTSIPVAPMDPVQFEPGVIAVGYPVSPVHVLSNRSTTGECTVGNQPRARIGQPKNFRESPAEPKCTSTGNSPSDQIGFGRIWRDQTVERPETKINAAGFKMPSKNYSFLTYWIYPSNPRVNDLLESCGLSNVEDGAVQVLKALGSQLKLNAEIRLVESYGPPGNIMFVHEVRLGDRKFGLAQSNTKSESQNRAALEALSALMEEDLLQVTTFNRAQFSRQTNNRRH